jgi:hypothetical protein
MGARCTPITETRACQMLLSRCQWGITGLFCAVQFSSAQCNKDQVCCYSLVQELLDEVLLHLHSTASSMCQAPTAPFMHSQAAQAVGLQKPPPQGCGDAAMQGPNLPPAPHVHIHATKPARRLPSKAQAASSCLWRCGTKGTSTAHSTQGRALELVMKRARHR